MSARPSAAELLETPGALLDRERLRELGLSDTEVDQLLRACGVIAFHDVRRVYVDGAEARRWLEQHR
jgi:hypothetical protein